MFFNNVCTFCRHWAGLDLMSEMVNENLEIRDITIKCRRIKCINRFIMMSNFINEI